MTRQPIGLHAPSHLMDGSDPWSGLPWAYLSGDSFPASIPNTSTNTPISLQNGVSGLFYTNDPNGFTNTARNIAGTDYYGIQIHRGGMYFLAVDGKWTGLSAAATASAYWIRQDGPGPGSSALSAFQFGRPAAKGNDTWDANYPTGPHTSEFEFFNIPGGGQLSLDGFPDLDATPVNVTAEGKQNGTGAADLRIQIWIIRIGRDFLSDAGTFG